MARLTAHLLQGAGTIVTVYPFFGDARRQVLKQRWSRAMLDILGIHLEADLTHIAPGNLLAANHISWLDIVVINAVLPSAFVAKTEVQSWPLIGWLAVKNDTVFLRRGSRSHTRQVNEEIASLLAAGKHVALFPEGTTTDGTRVLDFHAALLQPALAARRPVVPVAISYWQPDGKRSLAPRYDGNISIGDSLRNILASRRLTARLVSTPALGLNGEDRRSVAASAKAAVLGAAGLSEI